MLLLFSQLKELICHNNCIERLRMSCLSMLRTFDSIDYRNINRFVVSITYK